MRMVICVKCSAVILAVGLALASCKAPDCPTADYDVIPAPAVDSRSGYFTLEPGLSIGYPASDEAMARNAAFLASYIEEMTGIRLECVEGKGDITLKVDADAVQSPEGYSIKVRCGGISVTGGSSAGVFYAVQTIRKSLPQCNVPVVAMPCGTIKAEPRFAYRGVLFDTARHFFSIGYLKQFIDVMALHGCNRFHWHLTDDQGWRFEVKAYPLLTEVGSVRRHTQIGSDRTNIKYDGVPHGGFYTQEECRELVAYASERNIEIIPEIDLPGHMQAALAAYPSLGCTGGPYEVRTSWGISDDVLCVGNPATLDFLKTVLDELMDVFPSSYIHIGGDECPRVRWHDCPKCQAKAEELGLADGEHPKEAYLQSYIMAEVQKYLEERGRHIIGWDEMLEGEASPDATIMAWRAVRSGVDAVEAGHQVIMTPTRFCYFDYDQVPPPPGVKTGVGVIPLRQVYDFDPVPVGLSEEERPLVIGCQANLWCEYVTTEEKASVQLLPRLAAMSEVQWLSPERKDYFRFSASLPRLKAIYEKMGFDYYEAVDDNVNIVSKACDGGYMVSTGVVDGAPVHYTADGTDPTPESSVYSSPLKVDRPLVLKMAALRDSTMSSVAQARYHISKSTFKPVTLEQQPALVHSYDGASMLTDGLKGPLDFRSGYWLGFEEKDVVALIDMQEAVEVSRLDFSTCVYTALWLFDAVSVELSASMDGNEFFPVASESYPEPTEHHYEIADHSLSFEPVTARYFKVKVECQKILPSYHNGRNHALYMFVDEIALD